MVYINTSLLQNENIASKCISADNRSMMAYFCPLWASHISINYVDMQVKMLTWKKIAIRSYFKCQKIKNKKIKYCPCVISKMLDASYLYLHARCNLFLLTCKLSYTDMHFMYANMQLSYADMRNKYVYMHFIYYYINLWDINKKHLACWKSHVGNVSCFRVF